MDISKIYPYIVPSGYIETLDAPDDSVLPLGHDVFAVLVHDLDGICRNVLSSELTADFNSAALHNAAIDNLQTLAHGQDIQKSMHNGPCGKPFLLWSGHWLTASCALLPGLFEFGKKYLQTEDICISIPQREAMILFPLGSREERDKMRALIFENESMERKLITWELFMLSSSGLTPLVE